MRFEKEIERAVRHQAASDTETTKTPDEIALIVENLKGSLSNKQFDFSNSTSLILNQGGNKRFVKRYEDLYSAESVFCQCIKQIVDRVFKIKYSNRNETIKTLFGILSTIKQMSNFTIVKFDFKDYFNSVSAIYVFEKFIKPKLSDRFETDLISDFVHKTKYTYAGFSTSNAIAEIIAKQFDIYIRQALMPKGLLYFHRYVDDSVLIFNEHIDESEIRNILELALNEIFHDNTVNTPIKCKSKFKESKFRYISKRSISTTPYSIDYLGYEFWFLLNAKNKVEIKYGITEVKRDKYNNRIDKLISCYTDPNHADHNNLELLRHRIAGFTSRAVYLNKRFRSNVWKVKGFISNYGELRYLLETELLHEETKIFLSNMVEDAFSRASIATPYFLVGAQSTSGYNLFENMKVNKTILLVEQIGYDYNSLVKLVAKAGVSSIDSNGKRRGYGTLVRDYLIKIKIGY